ncbi:Lycopene beta and epsilon cyclase [Oscillochloris trichoides DG-6]|uniref:Lycopene beta and epsilon cyclase n=1 Tax=Oscillochloris trichoides DG-6 TaxID=765420 RepID=E1IFM7_9CHLR|nr:lycopene cyclase family protein [Oscillochloris trichoides]EFO80043.1 Lycopene beta and epsilon cyclase [Oscillochloris trichoides DG-6]
MNTHFDYIIAGSGAAGLSLAYHLDLAGLGDRRVLLIDQVRKEQNDRTWCFWETKPGPFEAVVAKRWSHLWFHGDTGSRRLAIAPYTYKLIQGGDFYRFMDDHFAQRPSVTRLYGRVEALREDPEGGMQVQVDGQIFHGRWGFNSIAPLAPTPPGHAAWLQHFKGWVIRTDSPVFDPEAATFMDFRVEQGDDVRFVYVLPYDTHTALIEDTYFSPSLLPQEVYDAGLRHYIREWLGVERYSIEHVEYGVIPMTDAPFSMRLSPHIMNIGTAGGMTKASTGYTFQRIQRQSQRIARQLRDTEQPFYTDLGVSRHALMDSVLLNVLDNRRERGKTFFQQLFGHNPPQGVLRFLDEESTLLDDVRLMGTVNIPAFMAASFDVMSRRALALLVGWA